MDANYYSNYLRTYLYDAEYLRDLDEHLQQEELSHTEYLD